MGLLSKLQPRVLSFTASPTRTLEKRSGAIELIRKCSESLAVDAVGELQAGGQKFSPCRDFTAKPLLCALVSLPDFQPEKSPKISLGLEY